MGKKKSNLKIYPSGRLKKAIQNYRNSDKKHEFLPFKVGLQIFSIDFD
jgi:hypothetical protein